MLPNAQMCGGPITLRATFYDISVWWISWFDYQSAPALRDKTCNSRSKRVVSKANVIIHSNNKYSYKHWLASRSVVAFVALIQTAVH